MNTERMVSSDVKASNRILPLTRWVAGIVTPVLLLAFIILFFLPGETGTRFAWQINPLLMSLFMGAGYLGGVYFFIRVLTAKEWHRVAPGFLPVTSFTWFMLAATILHWDRFSHGRLGFQLWIILYVITPLLVPFIWLRNRSADPVQPKPNDSRVPSFLRWFTGLAGFLFLACAVSFFIKPDLAINLWSWKLTPLTARVMAGGSVCLQ